MNKFTISQIRQITRQVMEQNIQEKAQKEYEAAWEGIHTCAQAGLYRTVRYFEENCEYTVNKVAEWLAAEGFKTKIEMANQVNGVFRTHIIISWEE